MCSQPEICDEGVLSGWVGAEGGCGAETTAYTHMAAEALTSARLASIPVRKLFARSLQEVEGVSRWKIGGDKRSVTMSRRTGRSEGSNGEPTAR